MTIGMMILFIIGVLNITFGLVAKTKNLTSTIIFNVIPFFCGLYILIYSMIISGVLK